MPKDPLSQYNNLLAAFAARVRSVYYEDPARPRVTDPQRQREVNRRFHSWCRELIKDPRSWPDSCPLSGINSAPLELFRRISVRHRLLAGLVFAEICLFDEGLDGATFCENSGLELYDDFISDVRYSTSCLDFAEKNHERVLPNAYDPWPDSAREPIVVRGRAYDPSGWPEDEISNLVVRGTAVLFEQHTLESCLCIPDQDDQIGASAYQEMFRDRYRSPRGFIQTEYGWLHPRSPRRKVCEGNVLDVLKDGRFVVQSNDDSVEEVITGGLIDFPIPPGDIVDLLPPTEISSDPSVTPNSDRCLA